MKNVAACLLTCMFCTLFSVHLLAGNDTQKKIDQAKSKAAEAYAKDQKGKSLEEIADEEAKKQKKSSRQKSVTKKTPKKPIIIEGHPSRLELWKKQREQQTKQQ